MAKRAKRKAHSEVRWVLKYGGNGFGNVFVHERKDFVPNTYGKPTRVRVTEILPTPKRKAKR